MNSKTLLIVIGALIIGGGVLAFVLMKPKQADEVVTSVPTPAMETSPTPFQSSDKTTLYQNASGFQFEHPTDIEVSEGGQDKTTYANLTLTSTLSSRKVDGDIKIKVVDTKLKDNAAWLKDNKEATKGAIMKTITIADLEALEFTRPSSISAVSVGQQVLYTFDVDLGNEPAFWEKAYRTILNSFAFALPEEDAAPAASSGSSSGGSSDIIFEGEEIIE